MSESKVELPEREPKNEWPLSHVIGGLVVFMLAGVVYASIYQAIDPHWNDKPMKLGALLVGLGAAWTGFGGAGIAASLISGTKNPFRDFGLSFRLPQDLLIGGVIGILLQVLVLPAVYVPLGWMGVDLGKLGDPAKAATSMAHGWRVLPVVLALCVVSPLLEELFFRGVMLRAFAERWGSTVAILVSAALFAISHGEKLQLIALFIVGAMLAYSAVRRRRLGEAFFIHVSFNAVTVISLLSGN